MRRVSLCVLSHYSMTTLPELECTEHLCLHVTTIYHGPSHSTIRYMMPKLFLLYVHALTCAGACMHHR